MNSDKIRYEQFLKSDRAYRRVYKNLVSALWDKTSQVDFRYSWVRYCEVLL